MTGTKKRMIMVVIGVVLVFLLAGCVSKGGDRGRIVAQSPRGERITIKQLKMDFAKYDVYYSGVKPSRAVSVLFCPKDGDTTIKPDRWWVKVNDRGALSSIVSWMHTSSYITYPTVQLVMGPNSSLFGYVYTFNIQIRMRVVSDKEMIVYAPVN